MRTFKNWKSELKKKGAMALTAFMLCGSAGTAFAQSTDEITISENNNVSITGYQTDIAEGYSAEIEWGDMLFIYDRGTYDSYTGNLMESKVTMVDESGESTKQLFSTVYGRCYDPTATTAESPSREIGFWYGSNNAHIKVKNLSTNTIYTKIAPTKSDSNNLNNVHLHIYSSGSKDANNDKFTVMSGTNVETWNNYGYGRIPEGASGVVASEDFLGCYLKGLSYNDKGLYDEYEDPYYLYAYANVYGTPGDDFRNATGYTNNSNKGEKIGEINISFNKVTETDGEYRVSETLTPSLPNDDADAGNDAGSDVDL